MIPLLGTGLTAALWCGLHSVFVAHFWRDWLQRTFPAHYRLFRILYVTASTVTLGGLLVGWHTLPAARLWSWDGPWALLRYAGLATAGVLFILGARAFDGRAFLGLRQLSDHLARRPAADPPFRTAGILNHIRHPWYSGTVLVLVFGLPVTDVNLIWRSVFLFYTIIGTELEERKLRRDLPGVYDAYRQRVGRFWPRPHRGNRSQS